MRSIKLFGKYLFAGLLLAAVNNSCTDLKEQLYDEVPADEAAAITARLTEAQVKTAILGAYNNLAGGLHGGHNSMFSNNEVATDEALVPQRGGDWYDGGQWIRMHQHNYNKNEDSFNNAWNGLYSGAAICNRLIVQIPKAQPTLAPALIAELRALRAYYYYRILDMWGKGPIFTKYPGDIAESTVKSSSELYTFVESELKAVVGSLPDAGAASYGRMTKHAANATLAKLYLNAGKYKGAADWAACNAACDAIISSAKYSLEADYKTNFWAGNEASKENVWVIPYDPTALGGFQIVQMSGHYETQKTFNLQAQPWNGYCTLAEFYDSYDATDKRKAANFLAGQQFAADGTTKIEDNGAESNDPDGKLLNFTKEINELFPGCLRQAGVRIFKYRPALGSSPDISNDFPIYRYADILLMKAEALWRTNAADAAALGLFNQVRVRAGVTPWTAADMTGTKILAELGREKFAEGWRRQDMIRFGKYFAKYDKFKSLDGEPAGKGVFPIPQSQIDANKNLTQNEVYK